jgi:hypothetical protein
MDLFYGICLKMLKDSTVYLYNMDYGDTTDNVLGLVLVGSLLTCGLSITLTALFPCSCRPRRDCRRNCSDCQRDRIKCRQKWYDCCIRRNRADTEEELMTPV